MEKRLSIIMGVGFIGYWAQFCFHLINNWHSFSSQYRIDAGALAAAFLGLMVQLWFEARKARWANWMILASACLAFAAAIHAASLR